MKSILLVSNHSLMTIEAALDLIEARKQRQDEDYHLHYAVLHGLDIGLRTAKLRRARFVACLGVTSLKLNASEIHPEAIVFVMGDPMTLSYIKGDGVKALDFESKSDVRFTLGTMTDKQIAGVVWKMMQSDGVASPNWVEMDCIPTIINAVTESITFIQGITALSYSIPDEVRRTQARRSFLAWVTSNEPVSVLIDGLREKFGFRAKNRSLHAIAELFDGPQGPTVRDACRLALAPKANIDKIAMQHNVSSFDLRYLSKMQNKVLGISQREGTTTEEVVRDRRAGRYEYEYNEDDVLIPIIESRDGGTDE